MLQLRPYLVRYSRSQWVIVGGLVALAAVMAVLLYPKGNEYALATDTLKLKEQVDKLNESLGKTTPSGSVTADHLSNLSRIETLCTSIQARDAKLSESRVSSISPKTASLCKELTPLVTSAKQQYSAVRSALELNSTTKRYMTLPGIKTVIRHTHEQAINKAEQQSRTLPKPGGSFPFGLHELTVKLKNSVTQSKGLSYMPALRQYQQQILAQRVQYWGSFADSHNLSVELSSQLKTYCHDLDLSSSDKICRVSEE